MNPSGKRWMHMIKPEKDVNLVSISAGKYNVWAISDTGLNKIILLKKTTVVQDEASLSYHRVRGIYSLPVVCAVP